jgi:hypothetical protein
MRSQRYLPPFPLPHPPLTTKQSPPALVEYNKDHSSQRQYDTFSKLAKEKFKAADQYVVKAEELVNEAWMERCHEEAEERAKQRREHKERKRRAVKEQRGWFEKTRFWLRYG